jgi:hypothetical protein
MCSFIKNKIANQVDNTKLTSATPMFKTIKNSKSFNKMLSHIWMKWHFYILSPLNDE